MIDKEKVAAPKFWLAAYLKPHWLPLGVGTAAMAARAGVLAMVPWPLKYIIDSVIYSKPLPSLMARALPDAHDHRVALLGMLCLLILGLGAIDALLDFVGNRLFLNVGQNLVFALRRDLFSHLQRLSLAFHRSHTGGDMMSRLGGDVQKVQDLVAAVGGDFIQHVLVMVGITAIMLNVDWRYALIVLAAIPVLFGIIQIYTALLRRAIRQMRHHEGSLWSLAQEVLASVQLVQACARERHEEDRFDASAGEVFRAGQRVNVLQAQFSPALTVAVAGATGLIAWYGAIRVLHGQITAGEMLVFLAYFRSLTTPTRRIAKTARMVGRASVALERIADYIFLPPSVVESPTAIVPARCEGRMAFEGVGFAYDGPAVLHDISFTLEPGRSLALVGPTGSGKSTIASLMARFYDPTDGRILLDGRDLSQLRLDFVRRHVALVLQEPVLFRGKVWENICYGVNNAQRRDTVVAAETLGLSEVIARLPGGFDCDVGERGQTLSGGQRQCISIARAMLRDAPIVVLDEPSSSLDAATERLLMEAMRKLSANRSSFTIAHRLKTVMEADEIIVLDRGCIRERGRHAELLKQRKVYAALWEDLCGDSTTPIVPLRARTG